MKLKGIGALWGMVFGFGAGSVWIYGCEPACERTLTCEDIFGGGSADDAGTDADAAMDAMAKCLQGDGSSAAEACSKPCSTTNCLICKDVCIGGETPACTHCRTGFKVYWPQSAELLASLLSVLQSDSMCEPATIQVQEEKVAQAVCEPAHDMAISTCSYVKSKCQLGGFAELICIGAILSFHAEAQEAYSDCMQHAESKGYLCDEYHSNCIDEVRAKDAFP